uniref:C3H1-type domain-containing protein n=1 Tax=Chelydra serpentina TaxID=8475 RepID=A0A8C3SKS7_CHESE
WVLYLAGEVNCSFYFKIGACRHGDRCSRLHNKPTFSQTIVLLNLYRNPQNTAQSADGTHCEYPIPLLEVFTELEEKYGEIEEMNICDNLGDHLVGNVYVKVTTSALLVPDQGQRPLKGKGPVSHSSHPTPPTPVPALGPDQGQRPLEGKGPIPHSSHPSKPASTCAGAGSEPAPPRGETPHTPFLPPLQAIQYPRWGRIRASAP